MPIRRVREAGGMTKAEQSHLLNIRVNFNVPLSTKEKQFLSEKAKAQGKSLAGFIREAALAAAEER